MTTSTDGKMLYVANSGASTVSQVVVDQTTHALTAVGGGVSTSTYLSPTVSYQVVSPDGKNLYSLDPNQKVVYQIKRDQTIQPINHAW